MPTYGLNKFFSAVTEAIGEEFKEEFQSIQGHTDTSRDTKALVLIMIQLLKEQKRTTQLLAQLLSQGSIKNHTVTNAGGYASLNPTVGTGSNATGGVSGNNATKAVEVKKTVGV